MEEFRRDLEAFQASEAARNDTLKRVFEKFDAVVAENLRLNETIQKNHEDLEQHKQQLMNIKRTTDSDPFVLVLIDGDISLFNDDYVRRGAFGGHDAARELRDRIIAYLKSSQSQIPEYTPQCRLIIKVYSKAFGLSGVYAGEGIISQIHDFQHFVHGFNQEHALCEFIDAGNDKEGADAKLKANLEAFFHNFHCKHILLGVSGDDSYAGFLRQYRPGDNTGHRITLIRALPFPREFSRLAEEFLVIDMGTLFRTEEIVPDHIRSYVDQHTSFLTSPRTKRPRSNSDAPSITMRDNEEKAAQRILHNRQG